MKENIELKNKYKTYKSIKTISMWIWIWKSVDECRWVGRRVLWYFMLCYVNLDVILMLWLGFDIINIFIFLG